MTQTMERTSIPGVFRRHGAACNGGRCSCPYVVIWRHRGRQVKQTFRTLAEAREAKGNREAGERRPVARIRFGDYFDDWIESYAGRTARGFSETTRAEYRRPIEQYALTTWATWRIAEVEPADVRELFGDMRRRGATTSAIKKLKAALSVIFATAVEDGQVRSNPVQGVRVPLAAGDELEGEREVKALTRAELAIFLAALPEKWRLFYEFLAHTGLRISEAVGLTWAHVELGESARLLVREQLYEGERKRLKTGNGRRDVPLSTGMTARLLAHRRDTFAGPESPVFSSRVGTPLRPSNIRRQTLKPTRDAVGLPWVTFHTFRHTCASLLFEQGRNVKQVSEWLGHADPAFTLRRYIHLMDVGVGDADFLDEVVCADPAGVG
ncbi:MAG: tyrosine-type recombinase/integrase [Candidatus Limnocylindria bacterium]